MFMNDFYESYRQAERLEEGFAQNLWKATGGKAIQGVKNAVTTGVNKVTGAVAQAAGDVQGAKQAGKNVANVKNQQDAQKANQQKAQQANQQASQSKNEKAQAKAAKTDLSQKPKTKALVDELTKVTQAPVKESYSFRNHFIHSVLREEGEAPAQENSGGNDNESGGGDQPQQQAQPTGKVSWKNAKAFIADPNNPDLLAKVKEELDANSKNGADPNQIKKIQDLIAGAEQESQGGDQPQEGGDQPQEGGDQSGGQPAESTETAGADAQATGEAGGGDPGTDQANAGGDGAAAPGGDAQGGGNPPPDSGGGSNMTGSQFFQQKGEDFKAAAMAANVAAGSQNMQKIKKADGDLFVEFGNIVKKEGR